MSWLYSQALVAEYSGENSSDGELSAPSNTTPTQRAYLWRDKTTEAWKHFPSGMTCEPLTESRGADVLTLFLAAFPARILAFATETPKASMEAGADYGKKCGELLARFDRDSFSWKTRQLLLFGDSEECLVTFPYWGIMQNGVVFEPSTLVQTIPAIGCGLLPTLRASIRKPAKNRIGPDSEEYRHNIEEYLGGKPNPIFAEWMMGWPLMWTDATKPLATGKFRQWLDSHGKRFQME